MMVWDLIGEDTNEHGLPPGFRFHPSDEELISFYLASKVHNGNSYGGVQIVEVDLNRCEPWELPDVAKMGEREWYFYSLKDRKYPTGLRTNRATGAGYWKATGKDREVYSSSNGGSLVGMKKTLVFYKGRAPRGEKTKWVLHEYRLDGELSNRHACKEEWVICRIFQKAGCEKKNPFPLNNGYFIEPSFSTSVPFLPSLISMNERTPSNIQTLFQNNNYFINNQLPQPPLPPPTTACSSSTSHANITSLLKPHQNHTPLNEMMIPVTKQSNIQTVEEEGGEEDGILNWLDYSNQHNPFLIDVGLFNSCLNSNPCGSSNAVHDVSFPFPPVGESQPLVPLWSKVNGMGTKVNGMGMPMAYL